MQHINLAVIGVGPRGYGLLSTLLDMEDVHIKAVCDIRQERVERAQKLVRDKAEYTPDGFTEWEQALEMPDLDAVIIATPWFLHIPVTIAAMQRGITPACEVGAAFSVDDCWELIRTYEATRVHAMLLENRCYNRDALTLLQMARAGLFGEIVACEMSYSHDLRAQVAGDEDPNHGRVLEYLHNNGNNYATHPLGPCANLMRVNRGNRMISLVAVASKARGMQDYVARRENHPLANRQWRQGDRTTVLITLAHGEVITLTLDTTLPRHYSHSHFIHGTRGMYNGMARTVFLENEHEETTDIARYLNNLDEYRAQYDHPVWQNEQLDVNKGHGGQDYILLRAFIDSVQRQIPPPIDVYDMAAWKSISPLSADSINLGGHPVAIPDFTRGMWFRERPSYHGPYEI